MELETKTGTGTGTGSGSGSSRQLDRRAFLRGAALAGATGAVGAVGAAGIVGATGATGVFGTTGTVGAPGVAYAEVAEVGGTSVEALAAAQAPVTEELPFPGDAPAPQDTAYACDVLVIGCGWAGIHAAVTAARAGKSVIVVDKGRPGYSGLSPFSQGCTYYDPDYDDLDAVLKTLPVTSEYLANVDAFAHTLSLSKEAYDQNYEFGFTGGYLYAPAAGYTEFSQDKEYFQANLANERHHKWMEVLAAEGVGVVEGAMVTRLLTGADGGVCGAVGLHVKSGTALTFAAKAVALCAGSGTYKAAGFVLGGDTFDGAYMAYELGCPIVGMEFEDFHETCSAAPGDYHFGNTWDYVEPYTPYDTYATAPSDDAEISEYAAGKIKYMSVSRANQALQGLAATDGTGVSSRTTNGSANPDDPRCAYCLSFGDQGKNRKADSYGAAPGMPLHMASGVYCGWDDRSGATPVPGLFVAGDGEYGDMAEGVIYPFVGSTSTNCSVQGNVAGTSAAAYCDALDAAGSEGSAESGAAGAASGFGAASGLPDPSGLPSDQVQAAIDEIFAPRQLSKGWDPNYVVDRLVSVMSVPEVQLAKDATSLKAALAQVEVLRDSYVPKMMGYCGHDLRTVLEAKHKVLSAEMKLRASLAREESRGTHYRSDFPYRDDENFLCHFTLRKAEDGSMTVERVEVPDSWKGDLSLDYATRYPARFPGEADALGLVEEQTATSGTWEHKA